MLAYGNFEQVFKRMNKPFWVLYKGATKGQQIGSNFSSREDGEPVGKPDTEDSFTALNELVSIYGEGTYTIECRSHPKASRGNDTHQFFIGEQSANRSSNTVTATNQNPAVGFFQGLDGRYFLDQISGKTTELQAAQLALLRKEMEVENLKRQLKEKQENTGLPDKIFGLLEKQPGILERILGGNQTTAIGTLKSDKPISEARENRVDSDEEFEEYYTPGKLDINALVDAAMAIQKALPHRHVNDIFDGLADMVEQNPEQAEGYLKMLLG